MRVSLSRRDINRIITAIDSHLYWELAGDAYRSNGAIIPPGHPNPGVQRTMRAFEDISARLGALSNGPLDKAKG